MGKTAQGMYRLSYMEAKQLPFPGEDRGRGAGSAALVTRRQEDERASPQVRADPDPKAPGFGHWAVAGAQGGVQWGARRKGSKCRF